MRRWQFISITVLLFFVSCRNSIVVDSLTKVRPEFVSVYDLKDNYPESAYHVFCRIADTLDETKLHQKSSFLFHEYQVLKAELNYKNYRPIINDSLVEEAFGFYDSIISGNRSAHKNKELAFQYARSCYYKAVVEEQSEESHVQSFSDYLKALWITDGLSKKRQVIAVGEDRVEYEHFTGLIYDRLAWFFYNHDAWNAALECLDRSNECFEKEGNRLGMASNFGLMGDVMLAQENRQDAARYYKEADSIYSMLQTDNVYHKFTGMLHRVIMLSNSGDKESAKAILLQSLSDSTHSWMNRRAHFGLGYIYYDLQEYDSALYHYEHSYPLLPRQTVKSYSMITQLANQLGDSVKAAYYGGLLANHYLDQIQQSGQKTQMVSLFEKYKSDSKDASNKDVFLFVIVLVAILAVIIIIDSIFIQRRKRSHRHEIEAHEKIKASLEDEIESSKRATKRKEEKIKDLETKLNKYVNNPDFQSLPFDKKLETLYEMPISKRARMVTTTNVKAGSSYPELVLSEKQMTTLVNAVDAVFPKFSVKIIEKYPRMKRSDVVYCCLYILGVTEVQAAALTGKTYQAVWTRSTKLHEIFDNKSNLQLFLHDFLRSW